MSKVPNLTIRLVLWTTILFTLPFPVTAMAISVNIHSYISCISDDTSSQSKVIEYEGRDKPDKVRSWFSKWLFGENFNQIKSKVDFVWKPDPGKGNKIEIVTNEKSHNLISIRSKTKESIIVVSSASNPLTTESWTFIINFNLESMIATRVQSNMSGMRGEVLSYICNFEDITPTIEDDTGSVPIG